MSNKIKSAFDDIVAEESLKQSTKAFLLQERNKKQISFHRISRNRAAVIACFMLFLLGTGSYFSYFTVSSSISIDINPSIEMGINLFDRVVKVEAYNEDAHTIIDSLPLKNLKYTEAIDRLMESDSLKKYKNDNAFVSVAVLSKDEEKGSEMLNCLHALQNETTENLHCYQVDHQVANDAHEEHISFGKYRAFLELQKLNPEITVEDIRNLPMREIQDMIEYYGMEEVDKNKDSNHYESENNHEIENNHKEGHRSGKGYGQNKHKE